MKIFSCSGEVLETKVNSLQLIYCSGKFCLASVYTSTVRHILLDSTMRFFFMFHDAKFCGDKLKVRTH